MQREIQDRMKLVSKAARAIADAIKNQKIGKMKNKNELSSQENTETSNTGAFGCDEPDEGDEGQQFEATLDSLANPQASTNDITNMISEDIDKEGEESNGSEEGRMLDPRDKDFSYIKIGKDNLRSPSRGSVTQAAIGEVLIKNNKKKK